MHTDAHFLDPILATPGDDAPRLIYADWLDEQGRCDQAEFIRLQCALALLPLLPRRVLRGNSRTGRERRQLLAREVQLVAGAVARALVPDWLPFVLVLDFEQQPELPRRLVLSRGFPLGVVCGWRDWKEHAEDLRRLYPLELVRLTSAPRFLGHTRPRSAAEPEGAHLRLDRRFVRWPEEKRALDRHWRGLSFDPAPRRSEFDPAPDDDGPAPSTFQAAEEAGRRLAMERERAVLDALLYGRDGVEQARLRGLYEAMRDRDDRLTAILENRAPPPPRSLRR